MLQPGVKNMKKQRGFVLAALITFIFGTVSLIFLSYAVVQSKIQSNNDISNRQAYTDEIAAKVGLWYKNNLAAIDSGATPTEAQIIAGANLTVINGMRVMSSNLLPNGPISYRIFVVWVPDVIPDLTTFNQATAVLTPPTPRHRFASSMYVGLPDEANAFNLTQKKLDSLAGALQTYAAAKMLNNSESNLKDYFRPDVCASPQPGTIPCIDSYQNINSAAIQIATGLSAVELRDGWGNDFFGSNLVDSSTGVGDYSSACPAASQPCASSPPYSMSIRVISPFGLTYKKIAIQSIQ